MSGIELVEAARLAKTYGDGTMRLGTDQNFVLTGVPEDKVDALLDEELLQQVLAVPGALRAGRGGLHRQRVLPVRRGRDQGARRDLGALARRPTGRGRARGAPRRRAVLASP